MTDILHISDRERAKDALILQMSAGRDKLAARVEALEAALRDITDPIEAMRRNLQEGYTLNGAMCVHMANDPETYRRMARAALKENQT